MSDYLTHKEIEKLKADKEAINEELEAHKYSIQHQLLGDMGKQMMEQLEHPQKPKLSVGLKYRIARWMTIQECKKKERELLKKRKKGDQ